MFLPFQSVFVIFPTSAVPIFFPFLIVGSAKVRIFFKLPNKINFIFPSSFSSLPLFQYAGADRLSVLPERAAKVAIFSSSATFILK